MGATVDAKVASYTAVLGDDLKIIDYTSGSSLVHTVDNDANQTWGAGVIYTVTNSTAGAVTVTPTSPATIDGSTDSISLGVDRAVTLANPGGGDEWFSSGDVPSAWVGNHTGTATRLAGFDGSGNAAEYTMTGTGTEVALSTSPTLVTPALGTPSALVGTNITGTAASLTVGATTGVEAGADVTDATNVVAAIDAAVVTDAGTPAATDQVLIKDAGTGALQSADFSDFTGSGIANVVEDTTPQLGGTLDGQAFAITTTGDITGGGVHVTGDTAAADNAALGYTATEGLILTGQGSTSDVTIKNDADQTVWSIPTGTSNVGIGTTAADSTVHVVGNQRLVHTATANDDHALELDVDAAGFGDVKGLDIDFITGAIAAGDDEAVILVNIDETSATGGEVYGLEVLSTDGSADAITAVKAGAVVAPILQDSGTFANPTTGTNNTTATDVAAMIDGSTGTSTTIFVADNDYILIGAAAAFTEIEFIIQTPVSNPGVTPTFGYSTTGAHQFTTFSPVDGTNGFTNTGVLAWDAADLTGHTTNDDTGTFDIKITRTHNSKGSASLYYAKTAATVVYSWGADGVVDVSDVTLSGVASTGTGGLVRATSPTLVTPALGTPASGVATNLTGTAAGLTVGATTGVEAGADVTDATNVTAAGALMDSELTDITVVKAINDEYIEDVAGGLVATGGTKTGITVTYQDGTGDMDFVIAEMGSLPVPTTNVDINDVSILQVGAIERRIDTQTAIGATQTLDTSLYGVFDMTMDVACTFTFSNPAASGEETEFLLYLRQDGSGTNTPVFPAAVDWAGGTAPTITTTASALDILAFSTVDAGTIWLGVVIAQDVK